MEILRRHEIGRLQRVAGMNGDHGSDVDAGLRLHTGRVDFIGGEYLFSGEWWITVFPGVALIVLVLSVNLIGDWLRDVFNPKLR